MIKDIKTIDKDGYEQKIKVGKIGKHLILSRFLPVPLITFASVRISRGTSKGFAKSL